jgi:hypothetical protein
LWPYAVQRTASQTGETMAYDDAAVFLARALPWPPLLAAQPEWFVNIHVPWRMPNGKLAVGGRACTTVNDAINFIEWRLSDPKRTGDIYVCMSAQRLAKAKTNKAGRTYWQAVRGAHNALWHKGFYIDVDVKGEGKSFVSSADALKGLGNFIDAVDLPMPSYVIASGSGGYHVHWTLADPITTEVWQPLAQALVTAMRHHGFVADYGCTTDAVRLLRVPGTLNYKHNPPKPVDLKHAGYEYQLSRIEDALLTYKSMTVASPVMLKRRQNNIDMPPGIVGHLAANAPPFKELVANQKDNLPTLKALADCCPFVRRAVVTGGKDYRQPLWWETAKLAFYTSRGVAALHEMSKLHDQYTPKETDELWARIERERTPRDDFGWPLCDTIQNAGARECGSCRWRIENRTNGRSPLHFIGEQHDQDMSAGHVETSSKPLQAPVTISSDGPFGFIPDPYWFDDVGKIMKHEKNDDDEDVPVRVLPYRVRNFQVTHEPWGLQFEADTNQVGWRSIAVRAKDFEARKLMSVLGEQGLPLNPVEARHMGFLLPSFTEQLRDRAKQSIPVETSGWSWVDGKPAGFVYGKMRYNCEGDRPATLFDANLQRMYTPTGSPDPWCKAVKMITDQKRPALEVIVAAAFGAPLMEFTGENGLVLSFRSTESGVYKTSAMKVGMAVWGNPKESMQQTSDTTNSILAKASTMKNFPIMCDEVHVHRQPIALFDMINLISGGRGKGALNRDRSQQTVGTWSTFVIMTSNKSVRQLTADYAKDSNAPLYRVLETYVEPADNKVGYNEDAQSLLNDLNNNFGHTGSVLAKYFGTHPVELKLRVENAQKTVRQMLSATDAERFWVSGIACILLGAKIANELKLAEFDLPAMSDFLQQVFIKNRQHIEGSGVGFHTAVNVVDFIAGFINDPHHYLLRTVSAPHGKGKPARVETIQDIIPKGTDMCGQLIDDPAELRLSKRVLEAYCKQQGYQAGPTIDELTKKLDAKKEKRSLGGGTTLRRAQEILFVFNRNHPDLKDLFS